MLGFLSPFRWMRWAWRALTFRHRWRKGKEREKKTGQPQTSFVEAVKEEIVDDLKDKK